MSDDAGKLGADKLGSAGDDFYEALMTAHGGLTAEQSARLNTRLVLLLANQVGDADLLNAALEEATLEKDGGK